MAALAVHAGVDAPAAARGGLALFAAIGLLWLTQALHLSVTALLVPLLAVGLGLLPLREALAAFAQPVIFLFLGGFALAAALTQHGLDRALAHRLLRLARGRPWPAVLGLWGTTALLSMWLSNTASAAQLVPVVLTLSAELGLPAAALAASVALAASCAFMLPVATPPNALVFGTGAVGAGCMARTGLVLNLLALLVLGGLALLRSA